MGDTFDAILGLLAGIAVKRKELDDAEKDLSQRLRIAVVDEMRQAAAMCGKAIVLVEVEPMLHDSRLSRQKAAEDVVSSALVRFGNSGTPSHETSSGLQAFRIL